MSGDESHLINFEKGNAEVINSVCLPCIPLVLLRYEAFADFYTEEPYNVIVKFHKDEDKCSFEQIFRLRVWIPNQITYSWSIYSSSRDKFEKERKDGLILRYVAWHRDLDINKLKEANKEKKQLLLTEWPELIANNIFLNHKQANHLVGILKKGDRLVNTGIELRKRDTKLETPKWKNMEINRLFDWGRVGANWSPIMENRKLEQYAIELNEGLFEYLNPEIERDRIYQMDLDFIYPPEMFKQLIDGSGKVVKFFNPQTGEGYE